MQKKVEIKNLVPGMYLTKVCGSWLEHPFWKKSFILEQKDIILLSQSGITEVWVDTSKGLDPDNIPNYSTEDKKPLKDHINDICFTNTTSSFMPSNDNSINKLEKSSKNEKFPQKNSYKEELKNAKNILRNAEFKVQSIFQDIRMGKAFNDNDAIALVDEISESVFRSSDALISISRLKNKDNYTYLHSVAVCALMVSLSKTLGYDKEFCKQAGKAGLLHDIGKTFIPLDILNKPGKLTDEEFDIVKQYPLQGWQLLKESGNQFSDETLDVCLHHHEKFDGSGYPKELKNDEISILSRMGAICDVYDAITSDRPYKKGWEPTIAIKNMSQWKGHFDPTIFRAFISSIGIYPVGSIVRLKSGKIGVVIERCESNLLTPKIKVFFSAKSNLHIPIDIIDLSKPFIRDKIEANEADFKISQKELSDLLSNN